MTTACTSEAFYRVRWQEGFGLQYPDGHVIRLYEHVLKHRGFRGPGQRLLDFGCWNGTHAAYFATKGFAVSGVDIVKGAVEAARERLPVGDFRVIENATPLVGGYDVVLANQVLYFLDDRTLAQRLAEFRAMLRPDGVLVATLMARASAWGRWTAERLPNGLERIPLRALGRMSHDHFVRFVESRETLPAALPGFTPVALGEYSLATDYAADDYSLHYIFVGRAA